MTDSAAEIFMVVMHFRYTGNAMSSHNFNQPKITRKGQITLPRAAREAIGLNTGDRLEIEVGASSITLRRASNESSFARYQGIGTSGIPAGREGIRKWLRELRGE